MLEAITKKEIEALLDEEIVFLKARSSYLSEEHQAKFKEILGGSKPEKVEEVAEKPAKKAKS